MMKLSKGAEEMADLLLKHYPTSSHSHSDHSHAHTQPQKPQQHMHDYRKQREIFQKPTKDKLETMQLFKEEGNNHFKNQRYNEAAYFYQKVIVYGDYTFPDSQSETIRMETLLQQANCNLALSMIKQNEWSQVKIYLIEATKGKNAGIKAKANYWLSKYYLKQGKIEEAKQSIKQIQSLGSEHIKYVQELQAELQNYTKKQTTQSKQVFKNMFKE